MHFAALDKEMSCIGMRTPANDLSDHDGIEIMEREECDQKYNVVWY